MKEKIARVFLLVVFGLFIAGAVMVKNAITKPRSPTSAVAVCDCSAKVQRAEGIAAVQGAYYQYGLNAYVLLTMEEERARRTGHTDRIFEDGNDLYLAASEGLCILEVERTACIRDDPGTLTFHWVEQDGAMQLNYDLKLERFEADMLATGGDVALTNIVLSGPY